MASRLLSETILTTRRRRAPEAPPAPGLSRHVARRAMVVVTVVALLLFLYLAEVSQGTTTAADIEQLQLEYHQLQERNQELERQIAELEGPQHTLRYAEAHGMAPRVEIEYLTIRPGR